MIYINTNLEMIAQAINIPDRVPDDAEQDFRLAVAEMYSEIACETADDTASAGECNTAPSPLFRDWNGGRHAQFHHRAGSLVCFSDVDERDTANKIAQALNAKLDEIAQVEAASLPDIDS